MYQQPEKSPWGKVQHCEILCPGVFLVSTASHGGTMFSKDMAAVLSPAARKCGFRHGGFLCFEEDSQEDVAFRELLDKRLWAVPDRIKDKAAFEENINKSIRSTTRTIGVYDRPGLKRPRPGRPPRPTAPNADTSGQVGPKWERRILLIGICKCTK